VIPRVVLESAIGYTFVTHCSLGLLVEVVGSVSFTLSNKFRCDDVLSDEPLTRQRWPSKNPSLAVLRAKHYDTTTMYFAKGQVQGKSQSKLAIILRANKQQKKKE